MAATENRKYPQIYDEFEVPAKDGKPAKMYWIQDAPEEMFDEIVEHFVTGFMKDEPICKYLNALADNVSTQEIRVMHRSLLEQKTSLVCLTRNGNGEAILVGFNILCAASSDDNMDFKLKGWFIKFIIGLFHFLDSQNNIYKLFGVDKCLKAMGLYVLPDYRGKGLGVKILNARTPLCKSLEIKITSTCFTSIVSQKQAYKSGFQDHFSIDYEELNKIKPEFTIPKIEEHTKSAKVLYKLIE